MPTASVPRRKKRAVLHPQDHREASYVLVAADPTPQPPPDPATLPPSMQYQREKCYAWAMANRFGEWLVLLAARERVPMDQCLLQVEDLTLFVEACLLAAATWPELYPMVFVEDDERDDSPTTEAEALAHRLTIVRPRQSGQYLSPPNLPGCHGTPDGGACNNLRRFGEKFCPSCRRRERARMRAERVVS